MRIEDRVIKDQGSGGKRSGQGDKGLDWVINGQGWGDKGSRIRL